MLLLLLLLLLLLFFLRHRELLSIKLAQVDFDLMTTFEIVHNLLIVSLNDVCLSLTNNKIRSAERRLEYKVQHSDIIASKYMHRLPRLWNSLSDDYYILTNFIDSTIIIIIIIFIIFGYF